MNAKLIHHQRVVNIRNMLLQGRTQGEVMQICLGVWKKVSRATLQGYIDEAFNDINRRMKK